MPNVPGTDHEPMSIADIFNRAFRSVLNALRVSIGGGSMGTLQVRRLAGLVGPNVIVAGKPGVRIRVISYTISIAETAELVELYFGGYAASSIFDGGFFLANDKLHSDCGAAGNGPRGETGSALRCNNATGNEVMITVVWTED